MRRMFIHNWTELGFGFPAVEAHLWIQIQRSRDPEPETAALGQSVALSACWPVGRMRKK